MQVQGSRASDRYTVFPAHFCSCQSFYYDVVSKVEALYVSWRAGPIPNAALGC